jgi:hypothetical protein
MLRELRPSELGMWAALYDVDPWDETRADLRAGIVASTIANVNRGRNQPAFVPADFMPFADRTKKPQDLATGLRSFLKSKPRKKR